MAKLKLKNGAKKLIMIVLVIGLLSFLGLYSYSKIKSKKEYEQTYNFKLSELQYNEKDIELLIKNLKEKDLDYILENEKSDIYVNLINSKYFIYDNFYTYLEYYNSNKDKTINEIVEKVNTHTNKEYYTDPLKTDISKKELMLVNKYYYLEQDYEPENLVTIPQTYSYGELGSQKVTESTYDAFLNLWNASNEAGYYLMVNSSYRTYEKQQAVYDDYKNTGGTNYADSIAARPGFSEHQTGYSLDIFEKGYSSANFKDSESYRWLMDNAYKYGFILRYPEDKVDITGYSYESWHFRYVGVEAATYIHENNITFDEYYAYFVK